MAPASNTPDHHPSDLWSDLFPSTLGHQRIARHGLRRAVPVKGSSEAELAPT